ncbi:MAG: universal stress protein [Gemmatimonadaceae bacterium]
MTGEIMKPERILVGIDFSDASFEAARWTSRHLGRNAELILAHVIAIPEPPPILRGRFPRRDLVVDTVREGADKRLRDLSSSLSSDRIWLEIREGDVTAGLADIAREFEASLLVVGAHGQRPGLAAALGSSAERLVRVADIPVLLVAGSSSQRPSRVLVPVDDSPVAIEALRWAARISERLDAPMTVLHVEPATVMSHVFTSSANVPGVPTVEPPGAASAPSDRWLDLALRAGMPADRVTSELAFGEAGQQIIAAAERVGAGLIVMGRRGAGGVRRAVLGSVVDAVLRRAPCPVLVVGDDG